MILCETRWGAPLPTPPCGYDALDMECGHFQNLSLWSVPDAVTGNTQGLEKLQKVCARQRGANWRQQLISVSGTDHLYSYAYGLEQNKSRSRAD